jgi:hypothetical protein
MRGWASCQWALCCSDGKLKKKNQIAILVPRYQLIMAVHDEYIKIAGRRWRQNIECIDMSHSKITDIPPQINIFPNLRHIICGHTPLASITGLPDEIETIQLHSSILYGK